MPFKFILKFATLPVFLINRLYSKHLSSHYTWAITTAKKIFLHIIKISPNLNSGMGDHTQGVENPNK